MDHDSLNKLYRSRPAARKLMTSIIEGGIKDERTTVDELTGDGDVSRRQAINVLRDVAGAGCGEFKVGRKGHPSRLEWTVDARAIAVRLVNGSGTSSEVTGGEVTMPNAQERGQQVVASSPTQPSLDLGEPETAANSAPSPTTGRKPRREAKLVEHTYVLRPDYRLELQLPADLTPREAQILGEWVRNLSFER